MRWAEIAPVASKAADRAGESGERMDIAFLTLFLGLSSGTVPVELSAGPEIAAIELQLDGKPVSRLTEPPWSTQLELGAELQPHDLVARALDVDDAEVGRVEQWINLPRPPAEVQVLLEPAKPGARPTVRLTWRSLTNEAPTEVTLLLDGVRLHLDAEGRAGLPPSAKGMAHVLSAVVRFAGIAARKDLVLGAEYGDAVATDLTGFAVRLDRGELPPPAKLRGWFSAAGQPLRVDTVESGPPHLIVVREVGAAARAAKAGWITLPSTRFLLVKGSRVRLLGTLAQAFEGSGVRSELFEGSQELDPAELGVPGLLARVVHDEEGSARTADAVAVAGVQADLGSGPRAVLLLLAGEGAHDTSHYSGPGVRRFLAALHVPLYVWSLGPAGAGVRDAWGAVEDVSTRHGIDHAFDQIKQDLERQRVVLVEGRHLPQSIAVEGGHGVQLVATP
jgi:hypothetical protein